MKMMMKIKIMTCGMIFEGYHNFSLMLISMLIIMSVTMITMIDDDDDNDADDDDDDDDKGVPDLPDGRLWDGLCRAHARPRHRLAGF